MYGRLTFDRFCHEDEEHDPSEEFEEYLACSVCGDNGTYILPTNDTLLASHLYASIEHQVSRSVSGEGIR